MLGTPSALHLIIKYVSYVLFNFETTFFIEFELLYSLLD